MITVVMVEDLKNAPEALASPKGLKLAQAPRKGDYINMGDGLPMFQVKLVMWRADFPKCVLLHVERIE